MVGKKGYMQVRGLIQQINKGKLSFEYSSSSPEARENWEYTKNYCKLPAGITIK